MLAIARWHIVFPVIQRSISQAFAIIPTAATDGFGLQQPSVISCWRWMTRLRLAV